MRFASTILKFSIQALRKQARHLENEIDLKLVAFSKVGAGTTVAHGGADTSPLLGEHVFDSLSVEIEQMLDRVRIKKINITQWCVLFSCLLFVVGMDTFS